MKVIFVKNFLQIWSHLLKKSLMGNFIFCAVYDGNIDLDDSFLILLIICNAHLRLGGGVEIWKLSTLKGGQKIFIIRGGVTLFGGVIFHRGRLLYPPSTTALIFTFHIFRFHHKKAGLFESRFFCDKKISKNPKNNENSYYWRIESS